MGFEYVDHPGDIGIRAWGKTPDEAFREAARGLFSLMVDLSRVSPAVRREMEAKADTLDRLLVEWLSALLAEKDVTGLIFSDFEVSIESLPSGYTLRGVGLGEPLDPARHPIGTEVKGISYLGLVVKEKDGGWAVQCIVDV